MQFKQGAEIFTADGQKVGEIDRVVMDPHDKQVTHLVAKRGFMFPDDRLVPMQLIGQVTEDQVTLVERVTDLNSLQRFEETSYVPAEQMPPENLPNVGYAGIVYWYPALGSSFGAAPGYTLDPDNEYAMETKRNIPSDKVALKEGAKVTSAEGKDLGSIERVYVDTDQDRATHFLISKGLLFKDRKLVPMSWVQIIAEDSVQLGVAADVVERLKHYEE